MYPEGLHDDYEGSQTILVDQSKTDLNFGDEIGPKAMEYLRLCLISSDKALGFLSDSGMDIDLFEDQINEASFRHFGDTAVDHACINEDMIELLKGILND